MDLAFVSTPSNLELMRYVTKHTTGSFIVNCELTAVTLLCFYYNIIIINFRPAPTIFTVPEGPVFFAED